MTTDRQRAEQLVLLEMLVSVLVDGVSDKAHPEAIETATLLSAAISETIAPLTFARRQKLYARRDRLIQASAEPLQVPGQPVADFGLAVYHLLAAATETGYLVIGEESALAAALDRILPALQPAAEDAAADERARRLARALLEALQARGCFSGLALLEALDDA